MGKKKSKKSRKTPEELAAEEENNKRYHEIGLEVMSLASTRWCTLHLKCTINVHLFFTVHVPVNETRLANIYDRIASRHGNSISDLTMYKLSLIHISEPTRLLSISYAVFCLKKKKKKRKRENGKKKKIKTKKKRE
eukprot:TRINITY_DN1259_c0_g1_i21.p2 TRINITY_DN1259_c0_g1~~TRINITY_DN1259_c0_g1_i21.p2  ORF type:complete len:136 (+),score=49.56 TRINITY_DN1259_c0_g1_i21:233-640(+)